MPGWFCPVPAARDRPADIDVVTASISERQSGRRPLCAIEIVGHCASGALWQSARWPVTGGSTRYRNSRREPPEASADCRFPDPC